MQNPKNLRAFSVAEDLAVAVCSATRQFPPDERFGLTSQMRRATVSVGSNIAEGCGRRGNKALLAFVYVAIGSCNELEYQLRLAIRLKFLTPGEARPSYESIKGVRTMLVRLVTQLRLRADEPPGSQ
ncbi:MAG TPA: four helix bundle protein [Gemmatimonadaceae bacterium]